MTAFPDECSFFVVNFFKVVIIMEKACETSKIAGVSFSLHPMSDNFVSLITNALNEVDASKVWLETDDVTTTIRGKLSHIFDVSKAMFLHVAKTGVHVAFQATYSLGCQRYSKGDANKDVDDEHLNVS